MKTKRQIEIVRKKLLKELPDEINETTWQILGMITALDYVLENKSAKQRQDLLKFKR